ncbi:MAG: hypothetical protein LBE81_08915 [Azonexus sp.]|uniref:hypothetical protein n=1 Tax=Azonexus sp. TaxID=1872668 RepID=UPI0028378780|nr:hypothetical protein [Azonexus sp.]MDR0776743.1 hypothetical protein [Azonexus sp.]
MGIDVFGVFQQRKEGRWSYLSRYYDGRRGTLRAWLGVDSYRGARRTEIPLILPLRGLPTDLDLNEPVGTKSTIENVIGEWGHSWLMGTEIINSTLPVVNLKIWIPLDTYNTWDKSSNPEIWNELDPEWQQDEDVHYFATPDHINENTYRVIVEYPYDFSKDVEYFIDEVRQLIALHGEVRFVYGFA